MTGQKDFFRRRISLAVEDACEARPHCSLDWKTRVDPEGILWVDFMCHTHGATWTEIVGTTEGEPCSPDTGGALGHHRARAKPAKPVWEDTEAPNPNVPKKGV